MTKFKYKFEAIKDIKERFEKIVQKEIAIINLDIDNLKTEIERLNNERKGTRLKKLTNSSVKISDLQFYSKHENYLESQIKILKKQKNLKN